MLHQNHDTSYNHTKQHGAIPVDLNGRCVVAEEIVTEVAMITFTH